MNTTTQNIECSWCGRHEDSVKVINATSLELARQHAGKFADLPVGIILEAGRLITWDYEDPKPADWQDYYVFDTMDEFLVDMREWWEK